MAEIHDLILRRHADPGKRGYQYDVIYGDRVLVTSRDPGPAACRALVSEGCTGEARFWREGYGTTWAYRFADICRGAQTKTDEGERQGPRPARWRPFDASKFDKAA